MEIPAPTLDYTVPDNSQSDVGVLTVPAPKAAPPSEPAGDTAPVTPTAPESTVPGSPVAGKKSPGYWRLPG